MGVVFEPHPGQADIWNSKARFRHVCCGRRWGKTRLLAAECIRAALKTYSHGQRPRVWIIAPTYKVADEDWSLEGGVLDLARSLGIVERVQLSDRRLWVTGGGLIEVRTADREDNLRGGGLDLLAPDEAGQIQESAWLSAKPATSDRLGRILTVGTPKGRNWWYRQWCRGQRGPDYDSAHESWTAPSKDSPFFPDSEWEEAQKDFPVDWFNQEYGATFLASTAAVFRGLDNVLVGGGAMPPIRGAKYAHGLDIAKEQDWSVLTTLDCHTRRAVECKRLQRIEYIQQAEIFAGVIKKFPGPVWADKTGVGPALMEPLAIRGIDVHGFGFTEQSKRELVGNLIVGVESRELSIPTVEPFEQLVKEMRDFEYKLSGTGQPRYGAPDGLHDDCVFSLALAYWGLHRTGATTFSREPNYRK